MYQDRVDETSMNFDIDIESDCVSDTETTFSNILKLGSYCFEPKRSNVSIEDSLDSEEVPAENLTQINANKDWCRCGTCRAMKTSKRKYLLSGSKRCSKRIF